MTDEETLAEAAKILLTQSDDQNYDYNVVGESIVVSMEASQNPMMVSYKNSNYMIDNSMDIELTVRVYNATPDTYHYLAQKYGNGMNPGKIKL